MHHHHHKTRGEVGEEYVQRSCTFTRLMLQGKVKAAPRLLYNNSRGRVLDLEESFQSNSPGRTVQEVLKTKHPIGQPADPDALFTTEPPPTHPVIFERMTRLTICSATLHCQGAVGPSGLDAVS